MKTGKKWNSNFSIYSIGGGHKKTARWRLVWAQLKGDSGGAAGFHAVGQCFNQLFALGFDLVPGWVVGGVWHGEMAADDGANAFGFGNPLAVGRQGALSVFLFHLAHEVVIESQPSGGAGWAGGRAREIPLPATGRFTGGRRGSARGARGTGLFHRGRRFPGRGVAMLAAERGEGRGGYPGPGGWAVAGLSGPLV